MSRIDPKNREEAFTYQFEDDMKMLKVASLSGEEKFEQALNKIESTISLYRNKRLRKECKKAEEKSKKQKEWMDKNFPTIKRNR